MSGSAARPQSCTPAALRRRVRSRGAPGGAGWWAKPASLTLPVVLGLLFLGLQHLFLTYMIVVFVPLGHYESPFGWWLPEIWWSTEERGPGILAEFARVNTLWVVYLWVVYRSRRERWFNRASTLMLVGLGLVFLATQYALLRLLPLRVAEYSIEVIRLAP